MQISVSERHVHLPDSVKDYARSKASKLIQFFDKIRTVDVIVSKEGNDYSVEIIVRADHLDNLVAHNCGADVQACTDIVIDKLERQITKYKEKIRNHKHRHENSGENHLA